MAREISNELSIHQYLHCGRCLEELPDGISPRDWAQNEVGMTKQGIQVWCRRHECNVVHIDFEGNRFPANVTRKLEPLAS